MPAHDLAVEEDGVEMLVPHVCATPDRGYVIRVSNDSRRHIACAVAVDGENALLRDGSLIVAPGDSRELPGFLVSKNFVGKEYVKEYRNFVFSKPKVVEMGSSVTGADDATYTTFGCITCDVFEAVLDEEVDSDQELRGQTTFYRGAGLHGSFDERTVPEGKKRHFLYSSVTIQGPRSAIANSTRGRWWIRGPRKLDSLQVRYREAHSLMLLGVDPRALGLSCREEGGDSAVKEECKDGIEKKECWDGAKLEKFQAVSAPGVGLIEVCDLTSEDAPADSASWSIERTRRAEAVDIER